MLAMQIIATILLVAGLLFGGIRAVRGAEMAHTPRENNLVLFELLRCLLKVLAIFPIWIIGKLPLTIVATVGIAITLIDIIVERILIIKTEDPKDHNSTVIALVFECLWRAYVIVCFWVLPLMVA